MPLLEICAGDLDSVRAAAQGGADRIELCSALSEGGVTPSAGLLSESRKVEGLMLHVLIRPRGGDFLYTPAEVECMIRDVDAAINAGADGVVIGRFSPTAPSTPTHAAGSSTMPRGAMSHSTAPLTCAVTPNRHLRQSSASDATACSPRDAVPRLRRAYRCCANSLRRPATALPYFQAVAYVPTTHRRLCAPRDAASCMPRRAARWRVS